MISVKSDSLLLPLSNYITKSGEKVFEKLKLTTNLQFFSPI